MECEKMIEELVNLNQLFQTADWKKEKHVPAIDIVGECKKGVNITLKIHVGKEIEHPNTTEHHIEWIQVLFLPEDEKFPYILGKSEFNAHGASVDGLNSSTVYSNPITTLSFKTDKSGTIIAISYCNIHGLWRNSQVITF
jgi:superoxide reductase